MPIEDQEVGAGLTKQTMRKISAPFGQEEIEAAEVMLSVAGQANDLDFQLERIDAKATAILANAGLPRFDEFVLVRKDGSWIANLPADWQQRLPNNYLQPREAIRSGAALVIERHDHDSQEDYAARALSLISTLKKMILDGEDNMAVVTALQLGALVQEARLKFEWELDAIVGGQVRAGGSKRGRPMQDEHSKWRERFQQVRAKNPGMTKEAAYESVAGACGVSKAAVKKAIQRLDKREPTT